MNTRRLTYLGILIAVIAILLLVGTQEAQSQVTPIYNNSTPDVDNETWFQGEDVTINSFGVMLTRIGTFVIGDTDSGAGPFFTGLLVAGLLVGIVGPSRVGIVAGGMLGTVTAAALAGPTAVGPTWVYGVVVMLVGFLTAVVYLRMVR